MATTATPKLNDAQEKALRWIVELGTGVCVNVSTGRKLARLGLVEERGGPDSMLGRTVFVATDTGRALAERSVSVSILHAYQLPGHGPGCRPLAVRSARFPREQRYVCAANCPRRKALAQFDREGARCPTGRS